MQRILAILLGATLLVPTTLASHNTEDAIADQAEFSINSALRLPDPTRLGEVPDRETSPKRVQGQAQQPSFPLQKQAGGVAAENTLWAKFPNGTLPIRARGGQQTGSAARRVPSGQSHTPRTRVAKAPQGGFGQRVCVCLCLFGQNLARWRSHEVASQPVCVPASAGSVLDTHCTSPARSYPTRGSPRQGDFPQKGTRAASGAHRSRRGTAEVAFMATEVQNASAFCQVPRQQQNWVCDLPARMDASWFCTRTRMSVCKTNMPSFADANNRATRYSYDRLGRVITKQLPLSEGTVTYTYDSSAGSENAKGKLAKLEDPAQTKTFSYDKLGRTKKEIRNHKTVTHHQLKVNYETEYEYDLLGRLKSIKYPENPVSETRARACYEYGNTSFVKRVQINVDAESLLFTENCNRDIVSNITYNEFGQTKMFRLGNGVETKYTYDIKGRLIRLKSQREEDGSIKIYQDADYAFAIDNNIKTIANNNSFYQANYAYTYDGLDRLVDSNGSFQEHPNPVNSNDTTEQRFRRAFQYAKNGNLTRKEIFDTQTQEVTEGWDYSYANHAATQIAVNGSRRFRMSYDSVGNLTEKEDLTNNLHKEITYDSYNRISQIRDAANDVVVGAYHYDDQGFRVHKKGYYEKGNVPKNVEIIYPSMFYGIEYVPEDSTADSINNIYLNGIRIAALDQNSAVAYFITDQVDSVNLILDDAGKVLTTTQHLPYGETFVHRGDTDFVPKFNSQELDKESGLYYFNARYYEAEIARFTSADTVIDGEYDTQGWNRFSYTKGNPILYKDPTGHVVDTIVDIASVLYDVGSAIKHGVDYIKAKKDSKEEAQAKENLKEDATALIADVGASAIPGLTGAGAAVRAGKSGAVKKVGKAVVGKVVSAARGAASAVKGAAKKAVDKIKGIFRGKKDDVKPTAPYKRPSGSTTPAQRASVQGKPCVDCGSVTKKQVADHKKPLVKEYYEKGNIDKAKMRQNEAVQPQCPTCSARQGANLSRYSQQKKRELNLE